MIIHQIHNLENIDVINLLKNGIASIKESENLINYHPKFEEESSNLFYLLKGGRYREGYGKYFILENDGEYLCSAGWNEYEYDTSIAIALSRMYVNPKYRAKYLIGDHVLPRILEETIEYKKLWITSNSHNHAIYKWFERTNEGKRAALYNNWPDIYKKFKPIGIKTVYFTEQYVVELRRDRYVG